MKQIHHAVRGLCIGLSALSLASVANGAVPGSSQTGAQESELSEVVVTGSHLITNGNNSPTPVTVLDTEQFMKLQPTTVTEAVNLLPALQGSQNVTSRPGGGQRNGAGAYMNLRNMGNLRTLVLFDGQRLIPSINQNQADTDATLVPQLLLKRADVVTGGVSAVYGSDAISGVINFITDRDFNGVKAQLNQGVSTYGDDRISDIGIAGGMRFAGNRGHVEASFQYHDDVGIQNRLEANDRDYYAANTVGVGGGTSANPYYNMTNGRISNATFGGMIIQSSLAADTNTLRFLQFSPSGQLTTFNHGLIPLAGGTLAPFGTAGTLATASVESGGDGAWQSSTSVKHGINFGQAFGRLDYDLTDNVRGYAQIAYSKIHSYNRFRSPSFISNTGSLRFSYANPFLLNTQDPYRALFVANPTRTIDMNEFYLNDPLSTQDTKAHMIFAGLDGKLADKFNWQINVGNSQSVIQADDLFDFQRGKLAAALDAVDVGLVTTGTRNGVVACRAAVAYTGHAANANYAGCVPLNLFGGQPSKASLAWLYEPTFNRNRTRLDHVNTSITGSLFNTWAGPVNLALSAEYRRMRWDAVTNTEPTDLANCTGISFNCTATTAKWFNNTMGAVPVATQKVTEEALEVDVPLLTDKPLFKVLDVTGAVRATDYSTSGNVTTWKAGLNWDLNDSIRFRATRSRDIRAPNLFDLFTSLQVNCSFGGTDPLTGGAFTNLCNTQGSNPNLKPEFADTLTVGTVLTPTAIPGLSLTVDYYKIDVEDVILLQQGWTAATLNFCTQIQGNAPVCGLITRPNWTDKNPATNQITAFASQNVNVAAQHTWGIDFEAGYQTSLFGRPFNARALVGYQPKLDYDQGPSGFLSVAGAYNVGSNRISASPKWKVTGVVSYDFTDQFNTTILERWRSGLNATYDPNVFLINPNLPSVGYTTLNMTYKLRNSNIGEASIFLNVQNLFDKFSTVYYSGNNGTAGGSPAMPEGDDTIGRYFTLGLRWKM
jgi:outer membrane receptor protein involved in Fe transport